MESVVERHKITKMPDIKNKVVKRFNTEEILPVFDKCLVLQRGKMADIGSLREVMSTERLSRTLETDVVMQYMQDGRLDLRVK